MESPFYRTLSKVNISAGNQGNTKVLLGFKYYDSFSVGDVASNIVPADREPIGKKIGKKKET
jgi:hypothetical protein